MKKFWTLAPWLTRPILLPPTLIFALIAARYLIHPVASAAAQSIVLLPGLGVTPSLVWASADFQLGCSIFLATCLLSHRRLLSGLMFVTIMIGVLLVVRVFGMAADSTVRENMNVVRAEIGLMRVTGIGLFVERRRRAYLRDDHGRSCEARNRLCIQNMKPAIGSSSILPRRRDSIDVELNGDLKSKRC
jgi:hypothetical protein